MSDKNNKNTFDAYDYWEKDFINSPLNQIVRNHRNKLESFGVFDTPLSKIIRNTNSIFKELGITKTSQINDFFKSYQSLHTSVENYKISPQKTSILIIKEDVKQLKKKHPKTSTIIKKLQDKNNKLSKENYNLNKTILELQTYVEKSKELINFANYITSNLTKNNKNRTYVTQYKNLTPNFKDFKQTIITINKTTSTIFNSTLEQWNNLFTDYDIQEFSTPIELINNTKISDLRLFLDELRTKNLIKNGRYLKLLENVKAFSHNGSIITSKQLQDAKQIENYPNTMNNKEIHRILNLIKNID